MWYIKQELWRKNEVTVFVSRRVESAKTLVMFPNFVWVVHMRQLMEWNSISPFHVLERMWSSICYIISLISTKLLKFFSWQLSLTFYFLNLSIIRITFHFDGFWANVYNVISLGFLWKKQALQCTFRCKAEHGSVRFSSFA